MLEKINKKYLLIIVVIILILVASYFIYVSNKKTNPIIKQVENFSRYQEITDPAEKYLGEDCANQEFNQFKKIVLSGSMKELILPGGLRVVMTPNYNQWSNEKFLSFNTIQPEAFCSAGGIYPLEAHKDNLLWAGVCSTGRMPEQEDPGYSEFIKCLETEEIINGYFQQ
ncbi:MAG: hypothetical protein QG603_489 [Patescibacteria group bacterium]|nr:hypothetical protein [Patescibacteria group bacterium]MDQ5970712.1 hypothetical protein [Patescibacteria group bacterium]